MEKYEEAKLRIVWFGEQYDTIVCSPLDVDDSFESAGETGEEDEGDFDARKSPLQKLLR